MKILEKIAIAAIVTLTVLLPLKFASLIGIPEATALFPEELFPWLIVLWPVSAFPVFSAAVLIIALIAFRPRPNKQFKAFVIAGLWLLLGLVGYIGAINAETYDFVAMEIPHGLGIGAYAASVYLLLSNRPEWRRKLLFIMFATAMLVALLGWEQRLAGFEDTRNFTIQQEQSTGLALSEALKARIFDDRIYSTFGSCNNLGGFLLMMLPLLFYPAWRAGGRIEPPWGGRIVFLSLGVLIMAAPFFMTASRAAFACLLATCVLFVLMLPVGKWVRWGIVGGAVFAVIAGTFYIALRGRGFSSMEARLDYQWSSLWIFLKNPFLGTGWGDFFHDYMIIKRFPGNEAPHDPHCMIAAYFSQCGILGGLVCLAVLFYPLWEGWRKIHRSAQSVFSNLDTWLLLGIAGVTMHSQLDTNMQVPAMMCYLAGFQIILLTDEKEPERTLGTKTRWFLQVGFVLAALWMALAGGWGSVKLVQGEKAFATLCDLASPMGKKPEEFYRVSPEQVNLALNKAVELRPYSPFPWQVAADFMFGRGLYDIAEIYYLKALELSPERASLNHRLHRLYRLTGNEAQAAKYLKRAQELFPNNEDYREPWSPK